MVSTEPHRLTNLVIIVMVSTWPRQIRNIEVLKSFFNGPTLLLIDELPHYLLSTDAEKIGNVTLADLTIAFVMNLISAVAASRNTILIMTLTAKQQLYENYTGKIRSFLSIKHLIVKIIKPKGLGINELVS